MAHRLGVATRQQQRDTISSKYFRKRKPVAIKKQTQSNATFEQLRYNETESPSTTSSQASASKLNNAQNTSNPVEPRVLRSSTELLRNKNSSPVALKRKGSSSLANGQQETKRRQSVQTPALPAHSLNPGLFVSDLLYDTKDVKWDETKVSNNRWLINVKGTLIAHAPELNADPTGTFMLIGDQIAIKVGRQDYQVDLKALKFKVSSATNANEADPKRQRHLLGYLHAYLQRKEQSLKRKQKVPGLGFSQSIANVLNQESELLLQGARGLQATHHNLAPTSVSSLQYFTQKGKTQVMMTETSTSRSGDDKVTFGPSIGTQYHWFFISEMKVRKMFTSDAPQYEFEITSNKFQYSFGRASNTVGGNEFTPPVEIKLENQFPVPVKLEGVPIPPAFESNGKISIKQEYVPTNAVKLEGSNSAMKVEYYPVQVKQDTGQLRVKEEDDVQTEAKVKQEQVDVKTEDATITSLPSSISGDDSDVNADVNANSVKLENHIQLGLALTNHYMLPDHQRYGEEMEQPPPNLKFENQPLLNVKAELPDSSMVNKTKMESKHTVKKEEGYHNSTNAKQEPTMSNTDVNQAQNIAYMCKRFPVPKSAFVQQVLSEVEQDDVVAKRLSAAKKHFAAVKQSGEHYNALKTFIDFDGKTYRYTGMPVGGEHHWYYKDSVMYERFLP